MRRFKPVSLKTVNIGRNGKKTTVFIPLRVESAKNQVRNKETVAADDTSTQNFALDDSSTERPSISQHHKRVIIMSDNWQKIREKLLSSFIEKQHLPENTKCVSCCEAIATTRCEYCGPRQYFCVNCAKLTHNSRNKFHVLEQWKDGIFVPLYPDEAVVSYGHSCQTATTKLFKLLDSSGNHHLKYVAVCDCEPHAVTLLKCQFWPGSPVNPTTGFHVKLLEFAEKVFLHCQVSLLNFSHVISELNPELQPTHVNSIYNILNSDCFEEFRHFMYEFRHLSKYVTGLYNGASCPLCPTDEGVLIESMDACFGLCRKKEKGNDLGTSKHGTLLFADQDDVDNFVNSYGKAGAAMEQNCSKFHAGEVLTALRSKGKNKLFDEKGVFGRVCRHDFPKGFHSIKHGERISYSVYELKKLRAENESSSNRLIIMYDIGCLLSNHLKCSSQETLIEGVDVAIPIFHCYGHKASCQVQYSPRRIEGIGLTDGEGVERLWSFLRRFSYITKEMSAHKRVDVLTDGLLHYGKHLYSKFGVALKAKHIRAKTLLKDVNSRLKELIDGLPVECDDNKILEWKDEEVTALKPKEDGLILQWDESYVSLLLSAKKLRNELTCVQEEEDQDRVGDVEKKIKRNDKAIKAMEKKHNIRQRWSEESNVFIAVKSRLTEKRKSELLLKLHCVASERCFLVEMKRKYADGQGIAIKLSKQIDKVVKAIHKTLATINGLLAEEDQIPYEEAKDPNSDVYTIITENNTDLPASLKRNIIDLFCLSKRCQEDEKMVLEEMKRLISFIKHQIQLINDYLDQDVSHVGLTACLNKKKMLYCNQISTLLHLWNDIWDTPIQVEAVQTYRNLSGIIQDTQLTEDGDDELDEEYDEDDSFIMELSSDSDFSDYE